MIDRRIHEEAYKSTNDLGQESTVFCHVIQICQLSWKTPKKGDLKTSICAFNAVSVICLRCEEYLDV